MDVDPTAILALLSQLMQAITELEKQLKEALAAAYDVTSDNRDIGEE